MTTPLRIETLTLCDYRAFPGPAPWRIELGGKNLLVYGENGAGKSSIFHALSDFFTRTPPRLAGRKNIFSGAPDAGVSVSVTFDDGNAPATWRFDAVGREEHPAHAIGDKRVIAAAQRRACLDYRALLDTNYGQGDAAVNLFTLARERLLAEYEAVLTGGDRRTVAALWDALQAARPGRQTKPALARVNAACVRFNEGFRQALEALSPRLTTLLPRITRRDVVVAPFLFGGVTWDRTRRWFAGELLRPEVLFRTRALDRPQHFLNEARLSGLGLAMYLAGRLATVPAGPDAALKLLVLDDVLIGLDQENRGPLLDVIRDDFADWQVVLLTHDAHWFDTVKDTIREGGAAGRWSFAEIYDGEDLARCIPLPTLRPENEDGAVAKALARAVALLVDHHVGEAANRVRVAWESMLRRFCERKGVPVAFKQVARKVNTNDLHMGLDRWADADLLKRAAMKVRLGESFSHRRVLNDGSHDPTAGAATTRDVERAIDAVRALQTELDALK